MHFRREVPLGGEQCFDLLRRGLVQLRHLLRRDIGSHAPAHDVEMGLQYFGKWGWCYDLHLVFGRIRSGGWHMRKRATASTAPSSHPCGSADRHYGIYEGL